MAAEALNSPQVSAGDAVMAFVGMLTSLPYVVPFGAAAWATPGVRLAAAFNEANGLEVSGDFPDGLIFPKIEGPLLATVTSAAQSEKAQEQMTPQDAACRILAGAPAQYTYWEKRVWREGVISGTRIATRPLERELAIILARQSALAHRSQHDYLPQSPEAAATWQPHAWVLLAIQAAAIGTPATHGDRAALAYLMQQFDAETWQCPQCGHAEDTATMDSAEFLRSYLAENPAFSATPAAAQEAVAWYYVFGDTGEAGPVTFGGNPGAEAIEWAERHGHTLHYLYPGIDVAGLPSVRLSEPGTENAEPRFCRRCGCTDTRACPGGCWWVEADLCSACAPQAGGAHG